MKKGLLILTIFAFALVMVIGGIGTYFAVQAEESYVCVDINPSVEFVVNRNNKVVSVNPLNVDATLVLSGLDLLSMDVEEAIDLFMATATELGYIDPDATEENPNAVLVTVMNANLVRQSRLQTKLLNRIDNYMLNNGVWGIAFSAEDMENIVAEAQELGVSAGKLRMVKAVQISYPEKTTSELLEMSIRQLVNLAREKNPADAIVESYEARLSELTSIPEEERTIEQDEEILSITEKLASIEELRALANAQKEQLRVRMEEKWNEHLASKAERIAEHNARRAEFQNEIAARMEQILQNKFRNRFN